MIPQRPQIKKATLLAAVLVLISCNPKEYTIRKYDKSKQTIHEFHNLLVNEIKPEPGEDFLFWFYNKLYVEINYTRSDEEFNYSFALDKRDHLNLSPEAMNLTEEGRQFYTRHKARIQQIMETLSSKEFKQLLREFMRSGADGFCLAENFFFFTFGAPGVKLKNPDVNAGILITSDSGYISYENYVATIDTGIYVWDSVLR